jgi:hypothetical protein
VSANGKDLFVADYKNHCIRKIAVASRQVTTIAGRGGVKGHQDGHAIEQAQFARPSSVCTGQHGVFVVDHGNHAIRCVRWSGQVITVAGVPEEKGHADGPLRSAKFNHPYDLQVM